MDHTRARVLNILKNDTAPCMTDVYTRDCMKQNVLQCKFSDFHLCCNTNKLEPYCRQWSVVERSGETLTDLS